MFRFSEYVQASKQKFKLHQLGILAISWNSEGISGLTIYRTSYVKLVVGICKTVREAQFSSSPMGKEKSLELWFGVVLLRVLE